MSIYFFRSGWSGPIKIGYAKSSPSRYAALAAGCPDGLHYLASFSGEKWHESILHRKFSKFCLRSEWFHASDELLEFVNSAIVSGSIRDNLSPSEASSFGLSCLGNIEPMPDGLTVAGSFIKSHTQTLIKQRGK